MEKDSWLVRDSGERRKGLGSQSLGDWEAKETCFYVAFSQGFRALYSGLGPAILGSSISWGIYFS